MAYETDDDLIVDEPDEGEDLTVEIECEGHDLEPDMRDEEDR